MFSPSKMFHSVSHFPCCIMFVIFSSVLHYLWHCMRYEAEPGLLMTALTSQPRTQRQEPGTLDTTSASWRNFSDIPYICIRFYITSRGKSNIERVWTISECLSSSVTPVLMFVSVCHIIATTSCCSLLARCQHWPVSRQRHSGLATSNTCRENQAVDRDKPWIYMEKLIVTSKYRYTVHLEVLSLFGCSHYDWVGLRF